MQSVQMEDPGKLAKVPGAHEKHEEIPTTLPTVPGSQMLQFVIPSPKKPTEQKQALLPAGESAFSVHVSQLVDPVKF